MKQRIGTSPFRMALALMFAVSLLWALFAVRAPEASAATSVSQCNSEHNIAGQAVECSYQVTNTVHGSATNSRVVATHCHGAANAAPTMVCTSSTSTSTDLVTSISQCNYAGDGGGGTMRCTVDVVNNITGSVTPTDATVNQCNGSADGTGLTCNPYPASTSGATVTQCNDSANGGGSTAICSVDSDSTTTSVIRVSINQCNNSENGGGSTVTCRAGLTDNVRPADTGEDDDDGGGTPGDGTPVVDTDTATPDTATPDDSGSGGGPPDAGITLTQVTRVPSGGASTGGGSTSGIENTLLLLLGSVLMASSVPIVLLARRASVRN